MMRTALTIAVLLAASVANACSCAPPPEPKVALAEADAAFVGTVTKVEIVEPLTLIATIEVSTRWKGVEKREVIVNTISAGSACGFGFQVGKTYLVYANFSNEEGPDHHTLSTSLCSRTKILDDKARREIDELGEPQMLLP